MPELKPYKGDYYLWEYVPNIGASVVFLVLFIGATGFHCWKAWRTKVAFALHSALAVYVSEPNNSSRYLLA